MRTLLVLKYPKPHLYLLLIFCLSCAVWEHDPPWRLEATDAKWFVNQKYSYHDELGRPELHPFFDFGPDIDYQTKELNFIVTTPYESKIAYGLDVVSGKRYRLHSYCEQNDAWRRYNGPIEFPPYTEGVVPRVLDQLGHPQKIVVFGNGDYYKQDFGLAIHRVQVVGALVEQICPKLQCRGEQGWESRMVLVAIDPRDPWLEGIKHIRELKQRIDWDYAHAFMENGMGQTALAGRSHPGFRVIGEISPGIALRFSTAYAHVFSWQELQGIQKACYALYDHAWEKLGKVGPELAPKIEKLKDSYGKNLKELQEILESIDIQKDRLQHFSQEFKKFHLDFGSRFQTCTDLVRPASINFNYEIERHWFFSYMTAFYKLQRIGMRFDCQSRRWIDNPWGLNGKRVDNPFTSMNKCTSADLDKGFVEAVRVLEERRQTHLESYGYLEYDNRNEGTHEKIYNWIHLSGKRPHCKDDDFQDYGAQWPGFPIDIKWQEKSLDKFLKRWGIIF